jgi:6-phosphogluconolactonase (cycloisomerase 2 family)
MVGIAVSPDGTTVLAGAADDHLLRVYARDASTGGLSLFASAGSTALSEIYDVKFSRDGQNVYYTTNAGDGIVVMDRNGVLLQQTQVITRSSLYQCGPFTFCPFNAMDGARAVSVSPDDQYVYVGGFTDNTLTVFRRNLSTGLLSRVQTLTRTVDGLNVLGQAQRIAVSPDNAHIYVAAQSDGLSVFQRGADGRLSLQAVYSDAMPGLSDFTLPADVVVSPDGAFVYATAWWDNAVHIFQRSPADGKLTLVDVVPGLQAAYGLAITQEPEGERLFLGDIFGDGVRVYARDPLSGTLSVIDTFTDTPSSNIDSPFYLAVSPDNMHLYVSLGIGQGVRLFRTIRHQPVVTHISPVSAVEGGAGFTLIVRGGRFYPGSQIYWNGGPVTTQFINENELRAAISAGSLATAGPVDVWVRTLPAGGGDSPARTFQIQTPAAPPIPSIASVEPPEAEFGEGFGLSVTLYGANFTAESQAFYNGTPVPTNFINSETLQVSLGADVLAAPGTGGFTVVNGGGSAALGPESVSWAQGGSTTSAVVAFTVTPPGEASLPSLASLAPSSVLSGSQGLWVTVLGYNFSDDAQAPSVGRWNGQPRSTVVIGPNELVMFVTTEDLHTGGTFAITVLTQGGGESEPLDFRVLLPGEKPVPVLENYFFGPGVNATLYANGSDFDPGAQIYINGEARATTYVNPAQVRTVLSAADTSGVVEVINPGPGGGPSQALLFVLRRVFLPILMR